MLILILIDCCIDLSVYVDFSSYFIACIRCIDFSEDIDFWFDVTRYMVYINFKVIILTMCIDFSVSTKKLLTMCIAFYVILIQP